MKTAVLLTLFIMGSSLLIAWALKKTVAKDKGIEECFQIGLAVILFSVFVFSGTGGLI